MNPRIRESLITLINTEGAGKSLDWDDGVRDALIAVGFTREQIADVNAEAEERRTAPVALEMEVAA